MTRLEKLIKEVLSTPPKKKDCNCGCGGCSKKAISLNEGIESITLSEGLQYHINNKTPLTEQLYRAGSKKYFELWAEARSLYSRNLLNVKGDDEEILNETHLGYFGMYEGKKVPLDFPIVNEGFYSSPSDLDETGLNVRPKNQIHANMLKDALENSGLYAEWNAREGYFFFPEEQDLYDQLEEEIRMLMDENNIQGYIEGVFEESLNESISKNRIIVKTNGKRLVIDREDLQRLKSGKDVVGYSTKYAGQQEWILAKDKWEIEGPLNEAKKKYKKGDKLKVKLKNGKEFDITFDSYSSNKGIAFGKIDGDRKPFSLDAVINEAKKKKKKNPPLNKPKRGGSKAYYVYVRDPKTKKIKKVSFGSGGLKAKINNPKARQAFAKRHNCKNKKDKTKAGYWSCRLPRYAKQLGLKSNFTGFW